MALLPAALGRSGVSYGGVRFRYPKQRATVVGILELVFKELDSS